MGEVVVVVGAGAGLATRSWPPWHAAAPGTGSHVNIAYRTLDFAWSNLLVMLSYHDRGTVLRGAHHSHWALPGRARGRVVPPHRQHGRHVPP